MKQQALPSPAVRLPLIADAFFAVRLVLGWTYFSAFWRRMIIDYKLDPEAAGYIGAKFNHFLPNAFLIKPGIEFFVSHPELLWWKLLLFTLVEGVVGLALMTGFLTRAAGLATSLLALGILLGAGWLGTTCLDEWQIGILGVAGGLAVAITGGGRYSLDYLISTRKPQWDRHGLCRWLSLGFIEKWPLSRLAFWGGLAAFALALLTNQVFHGGLWGPLHNKSVRPLVEVQKAQISGDTLSFTAYRVEGADVYGSFLIGVSIRSADGETVAHWGMEELADLPEADIKNSYVAKIRPGPHGLILPLGARAQIHLRDKALASLAPGDYSVELEDISGAQWTSPLHIEAQP
ncbi:quinol oxidase [Ruficoccus amylovorans]|uniref:Quinol oxidase n=1 Tax=Ruficoccus amylovorans TaxID=1804625 RepID=A0A842HFL1_9BACT|nr:TQO small subunit DoxD [Ruficoccus amylovorans]MBC2595202.1 quinol oxidase [Ruficoccus amylovorans]